MKLIRRLSALALPLALSGCDLVVMSPSGDIAMQQRNLIIISVVLMLLIIIPVICLTLYFAWHYRRSNTSAQYDPEWHHSTRLEVIIWAAPLAIIIALGAVTWISTHRLDPYRPLDRIDAARPVTPETKPITIEVVALDWKWLFLYPEQGIATVNEIAAPIDTPIEFKITGSTVMNSFYIPALAGQIYAMPGMQTKLHAVMNKEGVYDGFSANYSGDGFSGMRFKFHGMSNQGFDQWVSQVKNQGSPLNRDTYLKLERPSARTPVTYYAQVEDGLYDAILNLCVRPGQMCQNEMMHIDMMGGAGKDSAENRERLQYDTRWANESGPGATYPATGHGAKSPESATGVNEHGSAPQSGTGDDASMPGMSGHEGHDGQGVAPDQLNTNTKP
jgi:cytochrome o ubiquinol oxidase subunit II